MNIRKVRNKNKKALIYNIVIVLIVVAALISALVIINNKEGKLDKKVGERQINLIKTYQTGENILYNIDKSGEYAGYKGILEMNKKGGLKNSECGNFQDINMWTKIDENDQHKTMECYPFDEKSIFIGNFNDYYIPNLNKYLEKNEFELNNHKIEIKEEEKKDFYDKKNKKLKIKGDAINSIVIDLKGGVKKEKIGLDEIKNEKTTFKTWPVPSSKNLASCFGSYGQQGMQNNGIEISANIDTEVKSVANGVVDRIEKKCVQGRTCSSLYGNYVVIKHDVDLFTLYAHLSKVSEGISQGKEISEGDPVGLIGGTGEIIYDLGLVFKISKQIDDLVSKNKGVSPLCSNDIVEALTSDSGSCKSKYKGKISKKSTRLADECVRLMLMEIGGNEFGEYGDLVGEDPIGRAGYTEITENIGSQSSETVVEIGEYSIKPSFNIIIDYDFDDYRKSVEFSKKIVLDCDVDQKDIKKCVEDISKGEFGDRIEIGICNSGDNDNNDNVNDISDDFYKHRKINLCYNTNTQFAFGEKPNIYFALFIPDNTAPPKVEFKLTAIEKQVRINWNNLEEKQIKDVEKYHIYRNDVRIYSANKNENSYLDGPLPTGVHKYTIIAEDLFENKLEIVEGQIESIVVS